MITLLDPRPIGDSFPTPPMDHAILLFVPKDSDRSRPNGWVVGVWSYEHWGWVIGDWEAGGNVILLDTPTHWTEVPEDPA